MSSDLFDRFRVIDVDTHVTEPADVWTSRMSADRWGDQIPRVIKHKGYDMWFAGDHRMASVGNTAMVGFHSYYPDVPSGYDEIPAAAYDASARIELMDAEGIWAMVMYPNVGGFGSGQLLKMLGPEMATECVRVYNDFQTEFASVAPGRLLPVTGVPFWDLDASVAEIHRCRELGHHGVNFCNAPEDHGYPRLATAHWDPIWAAAQECGQSVNFHISGGDIAGVVKDVDGIGWRTHFTRESSLLFANNMRCAVNLIFGGACHRFPDLNFVSVESGVGWIPAVLEACDWQWKHGGLWKEHPEYDLLPSEYFRRQIYGCFWFEQASALFAIEHYSDNVLFETDYPHPTSQYPSPNTPAHRPREYATATLGGLPDATLEKILHANAAKVYRL